VGGDGKGMFSEGVNADFMQDGAFVYPEQHAKQMLAGKAEALRSRWKAQAEACIARHNLVVFGESVEWAVEPGEPEVLGASL